MNQEALFAKLPSEMRIEILSRVPVGSIMSCKCVCKSWLDLILTDEFVSSHLSKSSSVSSPTLAITMWNETRDLGWCRFLELDEDHLDLEKMSQVTNCNFNFKIPSYGGTFLSANGLLLVCGLSCSPSTLLCICNPATRQFIEVPYPQSISYERHHVSYTRSISYRRHHFSYGFGASKKTGHYKVVLILLDHSLPFRRNWNKPGGVKSEHLVYTVGTGSWRSIATPPTPPFMSIISRHNEFTSHATFLNGNLHWIIDDINKERWISCLDLETEVFSTLCSLPGNGYRWLCALDGFLCVSQHEKEETVIWLMMEYGVESSWTKAFVIPVICHGTVYPIKVFKDGNVLMMGADAGILFYYSHKDKTCRIIDFIDTLQPYILGTLGTLHTSTLLSFNNSEMEPVKLL
ncbi:hypothetical protein C2S53_006164 [Perilla frutescens var. hirtella]|uniref:F-box domain-containing protein n=1 Tax=Perilla frutescens var. hirtella TaxID=608512 RepID=A0AAD4NZD6_PERFH|nr:hypothetical protein C2S51_008124 [Perilla frutescens var. frutescens]KAH6821333.1 hypothetical protein C2S53_006164 [Perilla frutescens var. hirtella]